MVAAKPAFFRRETNHSRKSIPVSVVGATIDLVSEHPCAHERGEHYGGCKCQSAVYRHWWNSVVLRRTIREAEAARTPDGGRRVPAECPLRPTPPSACESKSSCATPELELNRSGARNQVVHDSPPAAARPASATIAIAATLRQLETGKTIPMLCLYGVVSICVNGPSLCFFIG